MFWAIPKRLHRSLMNFDVKRVSLSLMTFVGSPNRLKTLIRYWYATCSAVISSLQGMNNAIFVHPWSVIVRMVSYPFDLGNLVMKSRAIVWKGRASAKARCCYRMILRFNSLCVNFILLTLGASLDVVFDVFSHLQPPVMSCDDFSCSGNSWMSGCRCVM